MGTEINKSAIEVYNQKFQNVLITLPIIPRKSNARGMLAPLVLPNLIELFVVEHGEAPPVQLIAGIVGHDKLRRYGDDSDVVLRGRRQDDVADLM